MDRYDYVVVGAGSAGCVMAGRLSEGGATRVLLLEAGPTDRKMEVRIPAAFPKLFKTERDWDFATAPQPHLDDRELYWPRGRMIGGCSSINAQMYVRGNPADYDGWAAAGNTGWSWHDVLPYFRRSERHGRGADTYHGVGGPLYVEALRDPSLLTLAAVEAAVQVGMPRLADVNGATQDGVALSEVTQHRGRRWSAADAFLHPARKRSNLVVVTGAHATRVLFDGTRAVGVEYREVDRMRQATAAREVILCGGSVNSPQLLMLSGIGPRDALDALGIYTVVDLPGVGADLQDHLTVPCIFTVGDHPSLLDAEKPAQLAKYLSRRKGMLTSNVGEAMAFVRTTEGLDAPDLQLIFAPVEYIDHGLAPPPSHGITIGGVLLQPASRGRITLDSADPFTAPVIDAGYLTDRDDMAPLVAAIKLARQIVVQPALSGIVDGELWPGPGVLSDDDIEAFVRQRAFTLYHPVGTCRMGTDDHAVVDPELRVRGIEGLRVVDASVMPVIPRGNTNAPTIMVAERAADLVKAE
ncbi:MAG TPA: GMC family oxidoreductase N-terminal domain-containing protein [Acidimicrobiales bacterium]|nr:GMC family oxidoreductase N-terminal domain-containing protein [Acidimicrobiales bacterium]